MTFPPRPNLPIKRLGEAEVSFQQVQDSNPFPFVRTKGEWASENREQITKWDTVNSVSISEVYKVPKGRTFFITSATLSSTNDTNAGGITGALRIEGDEPFMAIILPIGVAGALLPYSTMSLNFSKPIKVGSGIAINLQCFVTNGSSVGTIHGYLE